ncbi:MAG: hypothetical protein LBI29_01090 [Rickettsiales bacterium]|nr:hypothetical protein [Rickettsiales bacterium]
MASFISQGNDRQLGHNSYSGKVILPFNDIVPYGKGKLHYSNGNTYKGDFINGKAEGHGIYHNLEYSYESREHRCWI